ncbi:GNAT family N-acetyltransferase [Flavobacterium sp.]|uniref:GNAT family N-acetyltransferase n=1 Tax=Flavobacterium sp. TaxID=239 RepID=UPI00374FECFC
MVKYLDWDSNFFKIKVGELIFDKLDFLIDFSNFDLIYIKSEQDFDLNLNDFKNSFSETKAIFTKSPEKKDLSTKFIFSINEVENIVKDLYILAFESGKNSRFLLDKNFNNEKFKELYQIWIDNSISKIIADDVFVYVENNKLLGFISYKINDNNATVGLFAVDNNQQGKGIGGKLLSHLENVLTEKNIKKLIISTQLSNIQSCKFYTKQGYQIEKKIYLKHYWKT